MGHGIKQHVDMFTEIGAPPHTIQAVGGGTKECPWLQSVSDISGVPEGRPGDSGCLLRRCVVGSDCDWNGQRSRGDSGMAREGSVVTPNPEMTKTYAPLHEIYTGLYQATKEQMHTLHDLGY